MSVTEPKEPAQASPAVDEPGGRHRRTLVAMDKPFAWGFTATIGGLLAISLGAAVSQVSTVLVAVGAALFIALALDPLVRWLENHKLSRGLAITLVFAGFALVFGVIGAVILPMAIRQVGEFAAAIPGYIASVQQSEWYQNLVSASGDGAFYASLLVRVTTWLSDPANLLALGGGALAVGAGLVNAVSGTLIVLVLTLYFLASMKGIKKAIVTLSPAYRRPRMTVFSEQIAEAVGGYVSGMAILAACNAVFAFILLSLLGVPFAPLLGFLALLITMIPMIGSVLFWILATLVTLFTSGWAALIFAVIYFAYMQIEAYVMTPRVMTKAVDIPGSLVLIGAMVGGTLLGLLGALVAVPVTASLLMIVRDVYVPKQDARTIEES